MISVQGNGKNQVSIVLSEAHIKVFRAISFYISKMSNDFLIFGGLVSALKFFATLFITFSITLFVTSLVYLKKNIQRIIAAIIKAQTPYVILEILHKKLLKLCIQICIKISSI